MFAELENLIVSPTAAKDASIVVQIVVALMEQFVKDKFAGNETARDAAIDSVISYLQSKKSNPPAA